MTTRTLTGILLGAMLAAGAAEGRSASIPFSAESRVWFTGSSNIRRFTCRAERLEGGVELLAGTPLAEISRGAQPLDAGEIIIPVSGLDCGIGAMNRHLREALHGDAHPTVDFRLDGYDVLPGDTLRVEGRLTIAGTERPVTLLGAAERDDSGVMHVRGSHELRVTDFGVKPPRRFLGLLKVRDRVTVHYDMVLGETEESGR